MTRQRFDDYEYDDYGGNFIKNRRTKPKKHFKGKGHQNKKSEADYWMDFLQSQENQIDNVAHYHKDYTPKSYTPKTHAQINEGAPLSTEHLKTFFGITINFDYLAKIEVIDTQYKGKASYGIKYFYTQPIDGKTTQIIWFHDKIDKRDSVYNSHQRYWNQVQDITKGDK